MLLPGAAGLPVGRNYELLDENLSPDLSRGSGTAGKTEKKKKKSQTIRGNLLHLSHMEHLAQGDSRLPFPVPASPCVLIFTFYFLSCASGGANLTWEGSGWVSRNSLGWEREMGQESAFGRAEFQRGDKRGDLISAR